MFKKLFAFLTPNKNLGGDIETARKLFEDSGLAFPSIPEKLAQNLKEKEKWVFSTRKIWVSPYVLQEYVDETTKDYAILSHAGRGSNSYAIQYYLVHGNLKMFLHLGWGGIYMDEKEATAQIQTCFSIADQIVLAAQTSEKLSKGNALKVVCSDFYGSYWSVSDIDAKKEDTSSLRPEEVLTEVLHWLQR